MTNDAAHGGRPKPPPASILEDDVQSDMSAVFAALLAIDFYAFIEFSFQVVRPEAEFRGNWHIEAMAHKLAQIARGEIKRLIITLPPRNLKSICASVALPAFVLGQNPSERVVVVSYSDALAQQHANDFRRVVNDPIYQSIFPAMRISRQNDQRITTDKRGGRMAASIDGSLTGLGGNLIVIDDPLKVGEAFSESVRHKVIEWYRSTLVTRLDDKRNDRIVVVMQRVHQEDLVGYLQEQGGFEVLNLPAIATDDAEYELGDGRIYRRVKNELLHPEHESLTVLRQLQRDMGPIAFSAQYQQEPVPPGGTIIRHKWLRTYKQLPPFQEGDRIIMSWDIALSERSTADYSACVVLHKRGDTFSIIDVLRGQFPFDVLKQKILDVKARYVSATLVIEESSISLGLIQNLKQQNVSVNAYRPETDKKNRLIAQVDLFSGGSILFPERAPWLQSFLAELLAFPGRYDDQVDALSQGLAWGRQATSRRAFWSTVKGLS